MSKPFRYIEDAKTGFNQLRGMGMSEFMDGVMPFHS